ncbi:MAG: SRPBCC family protein [Methyloceanibacter sp.]|uniref:SRPBCC family protein n=1 Tax=Methyloceanibacter sp. TaxID=1965321 RepID=UPI003D9AD20E
MQKSVTEFVTSRSYAVPRDVMWMAWTEPDRFAQWWGPKGFKAELHKFEPRPGGICHYLLTSPQGQEMWGKFVYREIEPPRRLLFVSSFSDPEGNVTTHPMAPDWPLQTLTEVTFEEKDGKTTVTVHWTPIDPTEKQRQTFEDGRKSMQGGWAGTFAQLGDYLARA